MTDLEKTQLKVGDIVEFKKNHPCDPKAKRFEILNLGSLLKIRCCNCGHVIIIDRDKFNENLQ